MINIYWRDTDIGEVYKVECETFTKAEKLLRKHYTSDPNEDMFVVTRIDADGIELSYDFIQETFVPVDKELF